MSGATAIGGDLGAGTSGDMDTTVMETDEYYNPEGGEWSQKVDTGQLCRVCANPNEYLIPIFDGEGLEHELATKIQKHLPIKVTETDTLPQHMCYQCASTLIAWHDLVIGCIEADKKLRELQAEDDDDDDDKGADMFESHSMDSEPADEVDQPSTSEIPSPVKKAPSPKKVTPSKEKKPKLKMVLVKGPPAGTSGQKTAAKTQVAKALELAKSKEGANQETASERKLPSSLSPIKVKSEGSSSQQSMETADPFSDMAKCCSVLIKEEVDISSHGCEYCGMIFSSETDLSFHKEKLHSGNIFHCMKCEEMFENESLYTSHMAAHNVKTDSSSISVAASAPGPDNGTNVSKDKKFKIKKVNVSDITGDQSMFPCNGCGKQFKKVYSLKKHKQSYCTSVYLKAGETNTSESDDEKSEEEIEPTNKDKVKQTFRCEMCGKQFTLKDSFKTHLRTHTGEKPFTCHICGKQFSHTGGLYYHLKHVHAGIKNHSCDICGRSFALKAAMEDHRRIHTGERPYVCHTCGKSFKTKASLYIHSKIHTDSFPHQCSYCERRFRWRQQLLAHKTTHTGEKPHKCEICGKGFGVKNDLTRHKLIHTDEKPFACSVCGLNFAQKRYLKNHVKSRHANVEVK